MIKELSVEQLEEIQTKVAAEMEVVKTMNKADMAEYMEEEHGISLDTSCTREEMNATAESGLTEILRQEAIDIAMESGSEPREVLSAWQDCGEGIFSREVGHHLLLRDTVTNCTVVAPNTRVDRNGAFVRK